MSKISEVYARALLKYGGDQSCDFFIQELKNFYKVVESHPQIRDNFGPGEDLFSTKGIKDKIGISCGVG